MAKEITVPHNFIPRDYQLELFKAMDGVSGLKESKINRAILNWHRRAGKDKTCWCYMIKEAAKVVGNYFYIFPTAAQARKALWENIDRDGFRLLDHIPREIIANTNKQEMSIEYTNGSIIRIVGYDKNPDSIRGVACKGAVFSEFAFTDPTSYQVLVPVIEESRGWVIVNSTPNGRNHFYSKWKAVKGSKDWFCSQLQTVWPDLPNYSALVPPSRINQILEEEGLDEEDIEREFGASFHTGMKGSYYANHIQRAYASGRIIPFLYDDSLPVFTTWDIGLSDYDVCWFGQRKGNKVYWIDYWQEQGQGTDDIAEMLKDKGYKYNYHYVPHDSDHRKKGRQVFTTSEQLEESLDEFEVDGMVMGVPKTTNRMNGINQVRKKFSNFVFDANMCKEGIEHLELYHKQYDHRRKCYLNEPKHDIHSHCADSIRIFCEYEDSTNDPFYVENELIVLQDGESYWT